MVIRLFGYKLTIEKDAMVSLYKLNMKISASGCRIGEVAYKDDDMITACLTDPDGYILPGQTSLTVHYPLDGCATATVTFNIGPFEHWPKNWISREPKPEHFFDRVREENAEMARAQQALSEKNAIHDLPDKRTVEDQITERVRELTDEGMHTGQDDKARIVVSDPMPPTQHRS